MKQSADRILLSIFVALFICFLVLPLIVMAGAAFNDTRFPSVWPWKGWTLRWFVDLANDQSLLTAVRNTAAIAFGVTVFSVPIGAAAAIMLDNMRGQGRNIVYALMTAPILTPAAVVGISTLIFWRSIGVPAGLFMTTLGVSSIISAFVMLLVLARLQSFDRDLEEAALDLGASHSQVLTGIIIPHLRPALIFGALISFLQALEAYNVPLFARGNAQTLTIYIASQVRVGVTPKINALALLLILATVIGGVVYEMLRRREARARRVLEQLAQAETLLEGMALSR